MSRVLGLGCVLRRHAGRCLALREVFPGRFFSSSAGASLRAAEIAASDEFGLTAAACSLIRERDAHGPADFSIWQAISDRAADLVDTASPKHLVWILAAFSDADFHPDERKRLRFLRAFRARLAESDDWLHRFSNDELCVTWRAFDRLQLLNKAALLQFHRVATEPLEGARCHGAKQTELPPRYSTFSLWNSVLEAEALRDAKRYPASSNIAKSLARQLLVDHEEPLREHGLSLDAIHAVADMTELSSRQKHRITAQLRELLPNLSAQAALVDLPRACARACITDEDFFPEFAACLARFWPMADSRQLIACWRSLLQWRVGPPGLDRCAAAVFCDSHSSAWSVPGLSPGAAVRQLRALGRLGASNLPAEESGEEAEVALLVALRATLLALLAPSAEHSLESRDLLLAMNALGQIARGWDWLGKEVPTDADGAEVPTPLPQLLWERSAEPTVSGWASTVAKLAGNRYKTLGEDVKAEYQKKFEDAKAKYEADMKAFLDAGGEKKGIKRKAEKASKPKKDPAAPKKPAGGAFGCFLAKNRAAFTKEVEGQPVTAITKLASEKWKKLSEDEKKVFQAEYETKKADYEEAKKSYVPLPSAENEETAKPAKKARLSKEEKAAAKQTKDLEKEQLQ
eukprot:s71_g16.t1